MFEVDGVTYAGAPAVGMRVASIQTFDDLTMLVTFSTGETRRFKGATLSSYPAFAPLAEVEAWRSAQVDRGVLTWNQGALDISTEKLYELSEEWFALPAAAAGV